jgi:hypothetical protein
MTKLLNVLKEDRAAIKLTKKQGRRRKLRQFSPGGF